MIEATSGSSPTTRSASAPAGPETSGSASTTRPNDVIRRPYNSSVMRGLRLNMSYSPPPLVRVLPTSVAGGDHAVIAPAHGCVATRERHGDRHRVGGRTEHPLGVGQGYGAARRLAAARACCDGA